MISTITSSTVSTITTAALAGSLALMGVLVLLSLLIQKELTGSNSNGRLLRLNKALQIGIVPLLVAFIVIVITKVAAAFH
jgi:hypothetical protein